MDAPEHYESGIKEKEEKSHVCKDSQCSWILKFNIITMSVRPKSIYRWNTILVRIPKAFYTEITKESWNVYDHQKTSNSKSKLWWHHTSWLPSTTEPQPLLGTALPGFRGYNPPWLRLSQSWDHKPLRRQSLSPWQKCHLCPLHPAWPWD